MHFTATFDGPHITCTITANTDLAAPIFCFSLMAPPQVVAGGTLLTHTGGYGEVQLPDLAKNTPHILILRHQNPAFKPANRAWLPLGPYLRHKDGLTALPDLPAGVAVKHDTPFNPFKGLRLIPQPSTWTPAKGTLTTTGFRWTKCTPLDQITFLANRYNFTAFQNDNGIPITINTTRKSPKTATPHPRIKHHHPLCG